MVSLKKMALLTLGFAMLSTDGMAQTTRREYNDIINIHLTPGAPRRHNGCFTDMGSWMGFTLPEQAQPTTGFCGPYSIYYRHWYARSLVALQGGTMQERSYCPGEVRMALTRDGATIQESLQFVDARTALLTIDNPSKRQLVSGPTASAARCSFRWRTARCSLLATGASA